MSMKAEYAADMEARLAQAGWLRRFARALLGNAVDAEDLAQDTLVAAWRQPSRGGNDARRPRTLCTTAALPRPRT